MRGIRFIAPTLFLVSLFALSGPLAAQDDDITWLNNYQEALKLSRQTGKPIFLEYRCEP